MAQIALHPSDVVVALRLAEAPTRTYAELASDLFLSASTVHGAVERLGLAGLVRPTSTRGTRSVNRHALLELLEHGLRYVFPGTLAGRARGVPTAHSGPALAAEIDQGEEPIVWPTPKGSMLGQALVPLYDRAVELPARCPSVYAALTLVDALRTGRARERELASRALRYWLDRAHDAPPEDGGAG